MTSLLNFDQPLRPYQVAAVADAIAFVNEGQALAHRRLYAASCGAGKGSCELEVSKRLNAAGVFTVILTPRLDVIRGFLERCGAEIGDQGEEALHALATRIMVTTPLRFRNRLLTADVRTPDVVIVDEAHRAVDTGDVMGTLFACAPFATWLGYTATPYRGTPKGTQQLVADWGEPTEIITFREAVEQGFAQMPSVEIAPLVDDDQINVVGGEFQTSQCTSIYRSRLEQLAELALQRSGDMPTMLAAPSTEICLMLAERMGDRAAVIVQDTSAAERTAAYARARACEAVLVQIHVVSEGVDLPWMRRLIDAKPTASPVAWLQQVGRITRPGSPAQYICTNRNLERHAYLLGGLVPSRTVGEAQAAFVTPSTRAAARHIGLECLGKFKRLHAKLGDGSRATMYNLYSVDEQGKTDYMVVVLPGQADPLVGKRFSAQKADGGLSWGKWQRCELPADFAGFATSKATYRLTDKMKLWWDRAAGHKGLWADSAGIKAREFQILPFLSDLEVKVDR